MEYVIYGVLGISVILNIFLIVRGLQLMRLTEGMVRRNYEDRIYIFKVLERMLSEMREVDIRGSFESDDEVGIVFDELKSTIEKYKDNI